MGVDNISLVWRLDRREVMMRFVMEVDLLFGEFCCE
jgi:hypothetical protein